MIPQFEKYRAIAYPYKYNVTLKIGRILGGTPTDPKVIEGWIKTKLGQTSEQSVQEAVAQTMAERGITMDEAAKEVSINKKLNGFKRDPERGLYIEGRQLKACLKESASVAMNAGKLVPVNDAGNKVKGWGTTNKGLLSWFPEHVFVLDDRIYLGRQEPDGINQKFVVTFRGTGIQYEEYVDDVTITATVTTDYDFTDQQLAMIWLTAEQIGLGASRSQGYGRFQVVSWEEARL